MRNLQIEFSGDLTRRDFFYESACERASIIYDLFSYTARVVQAAKTVPNRTQVKNVMHVNTNLPLPLPLYETHFHLWPTGREEKHKI